MTALGEPHHVEALAAERHVDARVGRHAERRPPALEERMRRLAGGSRSARCASARARSRDAWCAGAAAQCRGGSSPARPSCTTGRDLLARDRALLAHPRAEVDQLAALAAERPERRVGRPLDRALAGGAGDGLVTAQVQVVSVNRTSSVVWIGTGVGVLPDAGSARCSGSGCR